MEAEALNIPAVVAGAVAAFLAGWIIYHPRVFGTAWASGSGVDLGGSPPALAFIAQVIGLVALALFIGILVGTYSSIFVATPVVLLWHKEEKVK